MLGIKLEIEQGSVKKASKEINEAAEKSIARKEKAKKISAEEKRIRKKRGIEEPGDKKKGGAFGGAALGGFVGAIIGSLKPIQELLGVVAGILQIFLVPVLILFKPFLVLFLKIGIALSKWLSKSIKEDKSGKVGTIFAVLAAIVAGLIAFFLGATIGWIIGIGIAIFFFIKVLLDWAVILGEKLRKLWDEKLKPAWDSFVEKIKEVGIWLKETIIKALEWMKGIGKIILNWFTQGFSNISDLGKKITGMILGGLSLVADFGVMIWDLFLEGLSVLANLGRMILDWVWSKLPGTRGDSTTSVNDALITSQGQIINLNPNDNVLAFQDFSQVENVANQNGSRGGTQIFNFPNYMGDKEELIEMISMGLSKSSQGGTQNF